MTRRAIRAQRKAKEEMRTPYFNDADVYEFPPVGRIGAQDDAPFTLPNGTEIDPKSAWPVPGQQPKE